MLRLQRQRRTAPADHAGRDGARACREIIAALSTLFELKAGDLVFTGTPAGVAALQRGDRFHAELDGVAELDGRIV